jgi:hypothetical protein
MNDTLFALGTDAAMLACQRTMRRLQQVSKAVLDIC